MIATSNGQSTPSWREDMTGYSLDAERAWLEQCAHEVRLAIEQQNGSASVLPTPPKRWDGERDTSIVSLGHLAAHPNVLLQLWIQPSSTEVGREFSYWFGTKDRSLIQQIAEAGARIFGPHATYDGELVGELAPPPDSLLLQILYGDNESYYGVDSGLVPQVSRPLPPAFICDIAGFFTSVAQAVDAPRRRRTARKSVRPIISRTPCPDCRASLPSHTPHCEQCGWSAHGGIALGQHRDAPYEYEP